MLTIKDQTYSRRFIRDEYSAKQGCLTLYQRQTLDFCQRWLRGEDAFVLHTSGSTGRPKPITLKRRQMEASAILTGKAIGLRRGDRALVCLNTAYIAGVMMLVRGMVLGLEMTVVEPSRRPLNIVGTYDFTALVPLQVSTSLQHVPDRDVLDKMKAVLVGGAPVDDRLVEDAQGLAACLYHTYGMTETVSHIALRRLNGERASERFYPLDGVEIALDERGCLIACGPMTLGNTVVTNDRVELADDGSFVWLGRVDNVINSGGVKVQAERVERAVRRAFGDRRVFVVGLPDETLGQAVTAFVEAAPSEVVQAQEQGVDGLSRYERPKRYVYLETFQETETSKIDRQATVRAYSERHL